MRLSFSGHQLPLRRPSSSARGRWGWLALVMAGHALVGAALWHTSPDYKLPSEPQSITVTLASSTPSRVSTEVVATVMSPAPHSPTHMPNAGHKRVAAKRPAASSSHASHTARTRPSDHASMRHNAPPAPQGDLLNDALADVHRQGWQQSSRQYTNDSPRMVQAALARYRQDWVRAVQQYVDMHFPDTRRDARLSFDVTVGRGGQLLALDMIHSTGDAALDALALRSIRAAAPFRPFDAALGNRRSVTFRQGWVFNRGALLEP